VTLQDSIMVGNSDGSSPNYVGATFTAASSNDLIGDGAGATRLTNGKNGVLTGTATRRAARGCRCRVKISSDVRRPGRVGRH
jgi:hypothetical protein